MNEAVEYGLGIAAGEASVFTALAINNEVNRRYGIFWAAGVSAPLVEEISKSGFADLIGGNVLISHVAFGSTEGYLYGSQTGEVKKFDYRRSLLHSAFGVCYLLGRRFGGNRAAGYVAAIFAHFAWNQLALMRADRAGALEAIEVSYRRGAISWEDVKQALLI